MTHVIFVGPSLPQAQVRELHPEAVVYPPVRQGDIVSVLREHQPSAIGIIDGVFLEVLSVWHKEILLALAEGVTVYGAASMGALRAAECEAYGMTGVGTIYRMYSDGTLTRDDEVAVVHATDEFEFRPMSEPLVNIRLNLAQAATAGVINNDLADALLSEAASRYFPERSWAAVLASSLLSDNTRSALERFVADHGVDYKAADARELVALMARSADAPHLLHGGEPEPWDLERSHYLSALEQRDRWSVRMGEQVGQETIARFILANDPKASRRMHTVLLEILALYAARELGIEPEDDEIQRSRTALLAGVAKAHSEPGNDLVQLFCDANDLTPAEFDHLVRDRAVIDKAVDWLIRTRFKLGAVRPLLNTYRVRGEYAQWADAAALSKSLAEQSGDGLAAPLANPLVDQPDLVRRHVSATGWSSSGLSLQEWSQRHGFVHERALLNEFARSQRYRNLMAAAQQAGEAFGADTSMSAQEGEAQ